MSYKIHLAHVRKSLAPRREPYFSAPIAQGRFIGFRKIDAERGSWIARLRDDDTGRQQYKALGHVGPEFDYDKAITAAREWFQQCEQGIADDIVTVAAACRQYVEDREREKGGATAHDAKMRFKRTIYGTAFGDRRLDKLRTPHVRAWRDGLGLKPATCNRTLVVLKAALNLAVATRQAPATAAREWGDVKPLKVGNVRRALYLDRTQRRALLAQCSGALRNLVEAIMLTGARAGELTHALRSQFDARTGAMTFSGKTGTRTVPLSPPALALFKRLSKDKLPAAHLLTRDDGKAWAHSDWDQLVRAAASAAELPAGVCLYTLRHSFITEAINSGMGTLEVARLVGTSVVMIERHYGHLVHSEARVRLAALRML